MSAKDGPAKGRLIARRNAAGQPAKGQSAKDRDPGRRVPAGNVGDEDQYLWDVVARSVERDQRRKMRVPEVSASEVHRENAAELTRRLEAGTSRLGPVIRGTPSRSPLAPESPAASVSHGRHVPPPLADFDRNAVRRIRSGRISIEARLDLHGMRQGEAYRELRSFLAGCHARGLRWVLVITGKGGPLRDRSGRDDAYADQYGTERGVLKRNVPRWLAEPELRAIVVSYTSAALQHGGEGALYIQLRARRDGPHR
ncbi:MAG: Smr/MutS family protein [Hyphomicrobiaceae bacterium]|nr:Smr/MutS family protein [Hyphomicrobiaceae bacterium]